MLRSQRRGRDPPCWLSEKEPLVGKRRVNFQRCWLPVSRIGLHRRGVERVNCGPKLLDLGEKGVYSSYTFAHCGQCENCLTGHPTVCSRFNELNFGGRMEDDTYRLHQGDTELGTFFGQSSFGTYVVAHERNVVKVDKDVDLALLGPLGCGIQTGAGTVLNRLKPAFGTSIAIYGCGAVGLSAIMAARIAGCQQIFAIDVHDSRLQLAKELGATHALNGKQVDVV